MREIKFRVRNPKTKKIIGYEWITEHNVWMYSYIRTGDTEYFGVMGDIADREQFIGLRENWSDNGIEVYHNDILEAHWREDCGLKKPQTLEVTFLNGCFMIATCTVHEFYRIYCSAFKVIGNKWENPELLKEPQ